MTTDEPMDLATKTVKGSAYSIGASAVTMVLGLDVAFWPGSFPS